MSFFKSSKNQSASAASTPAQTPRSSMDASRATSQNKMTKEQAVELARNKALEIDSHRGCSYIRMPKEQALDLAKSKCVTFMATVSGNKHF
ncbi:hypothetical protein BGZ83_000840 [Gryganskiella cystojenkinii]|nr:hypothetical protein BGZ83_000840 [Gryganskiella cystojenkinii]